MLGSPDTVAVTCVEDETTIDELEIDDSTLDNMSTDEMVSLPVDSEGESSKDLLSGVNATSLQLAVKRNKLKQIDKSRTIFTNVPLIMYPINIQLILQLSIK
mgnify:CR=1 FL=1